MPIYVYQHPKTKEEFDVVKSMKDRDEPFEAPDGELCERVLFPAARKSKPGERSSRAGKKMECFEADPEYTKAIKPKFVKFRDGHRERYDPTKHC